MIRVLALTGLLVLGCQQREPAQKPRPSPLTLPTAERLFAPELGASQDFLVGATTESVWGARLREQGPAVLWTFSTPGILQQAAAGNLGEGIRIYLAFGRGRGRLDAPLTIVEVHPDTGERREIFREQSARADFTHLSLVDGSLRWAAFVSKYEVREWRDGKAIDTERMATSRLYADLDGDGRTDRVIGRIYGDVVRSPGDLRIELASGQTLRVPVEGGVRAMTVAHTAIDDRPTLYFADGWSASYAKEGRALLERVTLTQGSAQVQRVVQSHDEYTFNRIVPVGPTGREDLLLYGSSRVSWLFRDPSGAVGLREMRGRVRAGFGELIAYGEEVWMVQAGSPTVVEAAPSLR